MNGRRARRKAPGRSHSPRNRWPQIIRYRYCLPEFRCFVGPGVFVLIPALTKRTTAFWPILDSRRLVWTPQRDSLYSKAIQSLFTLVGSGEEQATQLGTGFLRLLDGILDYCEQHRKRDGTTPEEQAGCSGRRISRRPVHRCLFGARWLRRPGPGIEIFTGSRATDINRDRPFPPAGEWRGQREYSERDSALRIVYRWPVCRRYTPAARSDY